MLYQVLIINYYINTFFFSLSSFITKTLISAPQYLEEKQAYLIRDDRYFGYKQKNHTIYNYFRKRKIAVILENVSE